MNSEMQRPWTIRSGIKKIYKIVQRETCREDTEKGLKLDVKEHKLKTPGIQNGKWAQRHILHNLQLSITTQYEWNHREGKTNGELDSLPKHIAKIPLKHFNTHEKLLLLA